MEVLVAFIILGYVAGSCLHIWSTAPSTLRRIENRRIAVLSAQSLLAQIGIEKPLRTGDWGGILKNGMEWHISIRPYSELSETSKPLASKPEKLLPYLIVVRTKIGTGWGKAEASLTTLRLSMDPA